MTPVRALASGIVLLLPISSTSLPNCSLRYARNDELGTALGITVDFQSVKDNSFTLRDRDTTNQVRASEDDILKAVRNICEGIETWADVAKRLPAFAGQELE